MPNYRPDQLPIAAVNSTARTDFNNAIAEVKHQFFDGICKNLIIKNNTINPNYQVDIDADELGMEDYILAPIDLTADITVSGVNGLDTNIEAPNQWYSVWVIYNPTTNIVASLLSVSKTTPTMPSGYTKKQRVGWLLNNSNSNFLTFSYTNDGLSVSTIPSVPSQANTLIYDNGTVTGASWVIFWNNSKIQKITLGANMTISFADLISGGKYTLLVAQDGTGNRTIAWNGVDWGDSGSPILSTAANKTDYCGFIYNGTDIDGVAFKKGH